MANKSETGKQPPVLRSPHEVAMAYEVLPKLAVLVSLRRPVQIPCSQTLQLRQNNPLVT